MQLEETARKEKQQTLEKFELRSQETEELLCRRIPPRPVTPLPRDYSKNTITPKDKEKKTSLEGRELLLQSEEQEKSIHKKKKKIVVHSKPIIIKPKSSGLTSEERKTHSVFKGIASRHSY